MPSNEPLAASTGDWLYAHVVMWPTAMPWVNGLLWAAWLTWPMLFIALVVVATT